MFNNKKEATMKKTYKNPSMVVVKIQTRQMLAASYMTISNEETTTLDGRDFDFDDDEE